MSNKKPLISFIVTVYNLEKYIGKCLDSILSQDFNDYEIIVVDNASTDSSPDICRQYAEQYPDKIRFYQVPKELAIMGTAHRFGFKFATGKYIQYVDGDDRLTENIVPKIADIILTKNPDVIMGRFECYLEDADKNNNNFNDALFDAAKINDVSYDEALEYLSTLPNFQGVFWRYTFKKELFKPTYKAIYDLFTLPFSSRIYVDGIMVIKLFLNANSIYFLDEVTYLYTRRADGSGSGLLNTQQLSRNAIISTLSSLYILISAKPKNGKRTYLVNKLYFIFKFFKFGLIYLNEEQYAEIGEILDDNIELLEALKDIEIDDLRLFYSFIKEYGGHKGVVLYSQKIKSRFIDELAMKNKGKIYVFPCGNKTRSTLKQIRENGFDAIAVLDNDPKKIGLTFEGLPIYSPSILKELGEQRSEATVIVSALDDTLTRILTDQLHELGIEDTQIVIKE